MRKLCLCLMICLTFNAFAQEDSAKKEEVKKEKPVYTMFHMYLEYASGEMSGDPGLRALSQLDSKMTFMQNFRNAPWLSMGVIAQVSWNYGAARLGQKANIKKLNNPTDITLTASMGFCNIFFIGAGSDGIINPNIYHIQKLPTVKGLYDHAFTFIFSPSFYMLGNQFANGVMTQGWFDKLEMRIAYQMKFVKWFALKPEFLLNIMGTPLVSGKSIGEAFMFRFNPRLQFFYEEFSFFIEPRFYYVGDPTFFTNKERFQWEIKLGFDFTKLWLR
ncbi:MAG: hypothetical protein ACRCS8_04635 [Brevinema sp.]